VAGERLTGLKWYGGSSAHRENARLIKRARLRGPEALKAQSETETIPAPFDEDEETRNLCARRENGGLLKRSVRAYVMCGARLYAAQSNVA